MSVHVLGVRHHGPGSSRSVMSALDELQPSIVLIESPAETTAALSWVGNPSLVPPVALLGHVERFLIWFFGWNLLRPLFLSCQSGPENYLGECLMGTSRAC